MKFLADENISPKLVDKLLKLGIDILSARKLYPGFSDSKVLTQAILQQRILITADKDFGFWVFKEQIIPQGIILLRPRIKTFANQEKVLINFFTLYKNKFQKLKGKFVVLSESKPRIRKIT